MSDLPEDPDTCPECGERYDGPCEPPGAWFLKLSLTEQEEYIREALKP